MTTIGSAVLQVIPSLRGVSEAIDKQIDGKVISVSVEPKVDKPAAKKAGKEAGEAVAKETKDTIAKSSTGRDTAKILVDGIADGVKGELRRGGRGGLSEVLVDGLADGVKQGIDEVGLGGKIVDTISGGIKKGDVGKSIKDAILPTISGIGRDVQSSAKEWSSGIGNALRSGDIQGATSSIGDAVLKTTGIISSIGSTFGLQLDGVKTFGEQSASTLSDVGGDVQDVLNTVTTLRGGFDDTATLLGAVLPDRAKGGATSIINSLGTIIPVAAGVYEALDKITQDWHDGQQERYWKRWADDQRARETGAKPAQPGVGDFGGPPAVGQGDAASRPAGPPVDDALRGLIEGRPGYSMGPDGSITGPDGKVTKPKPSFGDGGYTGNFPIDKITGVVHGDEQVIQSKSRRRIESDHPGLLDYLNATGKLPGYAGGGLVAGTAELGNIIREKFGISNIGGYRPPDGKFNEHSTGRALDVMTGANKAKGDSIKDFVLANAPALDLKWVIWRQHLYYPGGGGYDMEDRGNPTANHFDHVHIFSGPKIAAGLQGALKGKQQQAKPAVSADSKGDGGNMATGGSAADAAPASSGSSGGGGVSVPSSLSGLSSWGLNGLGSGVGKTDSGSDLSLFGNAAGAAVSGQVSSALGVLGVPDSPGWLKGITDFVGGISVTDKATGKKVFGGGGSAASALGGIGSGFGNSGDYGGAAPVSASAPAGAAAPDTGTVHGGGGAPGPVTNYNIRTATVEDAWVQAQRRDDLRRAAKLDHH